MITIMMIIMKLLILKVTMIYEQDMSGITIRKKNTESERQKSRQAKKQKHRQKASELERRRRRKKQKHKLPSTQKKPE